MPKFFYSDLFWYVLQIVQSPDKMTITFWTSLPEMLAVFKLKQIICFINDFRLASLNNKFKYPIMLQEEQLAQ